MAFKRQFKDKYAGSSPENASAVRTLFDLFFSIPKSKGGLGGKCSRGDEDNQQKSTPSAVDQVAKGISQQVGNGFEQTTV